MDEVRMAAEDVAALAGSVLDAAGGIEAIRWPTVGLVDLAGSAVARAARTPTVPDHLADVAGRLRTWAAAAQASAAALHTAELRHTGRLGNLR